MSPLPCEPIDLSLPLGEYPSIALIAEDDHFAAESYLIRPPRDVNGECAVTFSLSTVEDGPFRFGVNIPETGAWMVTNRSYFSEEIFQADGVRLELFPGFAPLHFLVSPQPLY